MHSFSVCVLVLSLATEEFYCDSVMDYLQPDGVGYDEKYDDLPNAPRHLCTRVCREDDYRICYYRFILEAYATMNGCCGNCPNVTSDCYAKSCVTADGFERSIITINRMMPAPSIQVCEGDIIIVDVKNMMAGRSTTIHWHGQRQIHSKHMDGVPMVTQCPILTHEIFRYHYRADSIGTHFFHSHDGLQKVDGMVGSLIVRQPKHRDPNAKHFDYDLPTHCIVIQDWNHECADCLFPGLRKRPFHPQPLTYLIGGRGQYINGTTPLSIYNVTRGHKYVFRVIAGTCFQCQYVITFEKHDMVIIGTDGQSTQPRKVDSLTMSPGERYTVVVNCNKKMGSFWIQARAVGLCASTRAFQVAILRYKGHNGIPSSPRPGYNVTDVNDPGKTLNPFNSNCTKETEDGICISELRSAYHTHEEILGKCHKRIIWAVGFYIFPNKNPCNDSHPFPKYLETPAGSVGSTVNGIVYTYPPCPLLSQWADIPHSVYCPEEDYSRSDRWNKEFKECVHITKVPSHICLEILVCDATPFRLSHPIHLHGYDMCIVEQGLMPKGDTFAESLTALLKYLDSDKRKKVPHFCVNKDTVALSSNGYFVARIYTDNPGYWYLHCHFAYHLEGGMAAILKVGKHSEMPPPPRNFPKCGDYLPMLEDCYPWTYY